MGKGHHVSTAVSLFVTLAGAGCMEEHVATSEQPAISVNAISVNAISVNAISVNAINSDAIVAGPLATWNGDVADSRIRLALEDPLARTFMSYLVGCALEPSQTVTWTSLNNGATETVRGSLGLCRTWQTSQPDQECRERVSACILARNNAFGIKVQFSMRGTVQGGWPIQLADEVPVHDRYQGTNKMVRSLTACHPKLHVPDPRRDCGWRIESIGVCKPQTLVTIAAGNYAKCDPANEWLGWPSSTDSMLRVCPGPNACDRGGAIASVAGACSTPNPEITFGCPASGKYSVLSGAMNYGDVPDGVVGSTMISTSGCLHDATQAGPRLAQGCSECVAAVCEVDSYCCNNYWDGICVNEAETMCRYPASERRVFRWREGSFYGDLFGRNNINPAVPQVSVNPVTFTVEGGGAAQNFVGVLFPHMYACSSQNWTTPVAYFERRVCAGPDPANPSEYTRACAANYVGRCIDQCGTLDAGAPGDYDAAGCRDFKQDVWQTPMTTLLATPSDAINDPAWNQTGPQSDIDNW